MAKTATVSLAMADCVSEVAGQRDGTVGDRTRAPCSPTSAVPSGIDGQIVVCTQLSHVHLTSVQLLEY